MANRRDWTMSFILAAQASGSFNSTFQNAQSRVAELQRQIQNLNRVQSDIQAYTRQTQAVANTEQKLENLRRQYALYTQEIANTTGSTAGLERQQLALGQKITNTENALQRQNGRLGELSSSLYAAGVNMSDLSGESQRLAAEAADLAKEQERVATEAQQFGEAQVDAFDAAAAAFVESGLNDALKALYEDYKACVQIAGGFEETMSAVEAISGANATEYDALAEKAKELGATTKFTATESAEAMTYMAMAGWSATEMLQGMDGVIALAAAGGEDLSTTSRIVADSLTAFGLTAADTAHFADVMAAAATNSNTNVAIMGETFKTAAPVAGALGFSIEDVSVALGLMANAGVKGTMAGTALRNIFNGLLKGVTLNSAALGEFNYTAVNADGTMKSFGTIIDELRGYFEQMTGAEKTANASTLAGIRGYSGLLSILNATEEDMTDLRDAITGSAGAAQRMADIKLDNFNGSVVIMKSAWDAVKTSIGEEALPVLTDLTKVLTVVLTDVNQFIKENPGLVSGIMATTTVIIGATAALSAYVAVKKALTAIKLAGLFTGAVGPITAVVAGLGLLAGIITTVAVNAKDTGADVSNLNSAIDGLENTVSSANREFSDTSAEIEGTAILARQYIDVLRTLESQGLTSAEAQGEYSATVDKLNTIMPNLNASIDEQTGLVQGGTDALYGQIEAWQQLALQQALQNRFTAELQQYANAELELAIAQANVKKTETEIGVAEDKLASTRARMADITTELDAIYASGVTLTDEQISQIDELTDEYEQLSSEESTYENQIRDGKFAIDDYNEAISDAQEVMDATSEEISEAQQAVDEYTASLNSGTDASNEYANTTEDMNNILNNTIERVKTLTEAYNEVYEAALKNVQGQYDIWDEIDDIVATSSGTLIENISKQAEHWKTYNDNLAALGERSKDIEGLSKMIASFADGSEESVNAVAGMASANDEDLQTMVDNWLELQKQQDDVASNIAELSTNYTQEMQNIVNETRADITEMDFGPEATQSGVNTIQGFIDGASGMIPQVQAAYRRIAREAINAIDSTLDINSPSKVMEERADYTWQGFINETNRMTDLVASTMSAPINAGLDEMQQTQYVAFDPMFMAALSARETVGAETYGSGGGSPINVQFVIEGNADGDTVDRLNSYGEEFAARVLAVISDANEDAERSGYR